MGRETIDIQLTPEERSLLLRYGYPFEQIERALKNCEVSHAIEIVPLDCIELERLIGECADPSTPCTVARCRISSWISAIDWKPPKHSATACWTCFDQAPQRRSPRPAPPAGPTPAAHRSPARIASDQNPPIARSPKGHVCSTVCWTLVRS